MIRYTVKNAYSSSICNSPKLKTTGDSSNNRMELAVLLCNVIPYGNNNTRPQLCATAWANLNIMLNHIVRKSMFIFIEDFKIRKLIYGDRSQENGYLRGEGRLVIWRGHRWVLVMFYFLTCMMVPGYVCLHSNSVRSALTIGGHL